MSSETESTKKTGRAEKILTLIAVLLLLFATSALYFDDWLWSGLRSREDAIGMITSETGDVRLKFDQEVTWQKASSGQPLQYNDSIFAGKASQATLKLGKSELKVTQNSLVVLRREMDANFLNLSFGTLFGRVAKNEKVYIDTGSGKPTLLKTNSEAQIVLKKKGNKTSLEVVKGIAEVEVNGVKKSLGPNTQVVLPSKAGVPVVEKKLDLHLLPPSPEGTIYSSTEQDLTFAWSYGKPDKDFSQDRFVVEFSKDSSFLNSLKKSVQGTNTIQLHIAGSKQLFYRVKGPKGELSATHQFGFVRLHPPKIVTPVQDQLFQTGYRQNEDVLVQMKRGPLQPKIWSQIAADPEFKTVLVNESLDQDRWVKSLPAGQYYLRARSDYGNQHLSEWTDARIFRIKESLPRIKTPIATLDHEVTIKNQPYPEYLYGSSDQEVQQYLWDKGFLRDYFSDLKPSYDQLAVDFGNGEMVSIRDAALPPSKIYPQSLSYRYQLQKAGRLPSAWSPKESLKIKLEPPRENFVNIVPEQLRNDGKVPVKIEFTPVLFAKSYDFEISNQPSFSNPTKLKGKALSRNVRLGLNRDYYWRVRALDGKGQPLSGYSAPRKLSSKELGQQVRLAQAEKAKKQERKPAAVTQMETRSSVNDVSDFQKPHHFWSWVGSGFSYVNYKQSIADRGDLNSSSRNDSPGQYFELGYIGDTGYGGVIGYKSTPGEVIVENATLDKTKYVWRTISIEGLMLRRAKFTLFGLPINYGPRLGVQSHSIPYLFLNSSDQLELKQNDMLTASVGVMAEVPDGRWRFHTYMRYQFPMSASSGGASDFELKPKFAFDGLLGTSYYFTPNFKVGAFWYGQWHYYNFVYSDGSITNNGSQSLFYSTMDLRLGFDF